MEVLMTMLEACEACALTVTPAIGLIDERLQIAVQGLTSGAADRAAWTETLEFPDTSLGGAR
jgi:hypothetical protein